MGTSVLHIKTEVECRVYLFDEEKGIVKPGTYFNLEVRKGEQNLLFVSTEDDAIICFMTYTVEEGDCDYRMTLEQSQFINVNTSATDEEISEGVKNTKLAVPKLPEGALSGLSLRDLQNILEASVMPKGVLPGLFTINGDGDKVSFAKGNLQYQASTGIWRFAEHQWDYEGAAKIKIGVTNNGWIDLFGWGTGNNPTPAFEDYSYYSTFVDWGKNVISNGGNTPNLWRTLTVDEWEYLLFTRTDADAKLATGSIEGVHGLILLPDSWTLPSRCSFNTGINEWDNNRYTLSEWAMMEAAGAIFLPAAGFRWGTRVYYVDFDGYYWSSTPGNEYNACYLYFGGGNAYTYFDYRNRVQSVRLVWDIKVLKQ